jgi:hypothetical protein
MTYSASVASTADVDEVVASIERLGGSIITVRHNEGRIRFLAEPEVYDAICSMGDVKSVTNESSEDALRGRGCIGI